MHRFSMKELTDIFSTSTGAIEHDYFHISIDGGDPVYRERVYCYELYHQMRLRWPPNCQYYLNGELDKAAHPILEKIGADHAKPDLLVHLPGYMIGNYAVIEVKRAESQKEGIRKDLSKLDLFVRTVGYKRAVYLFFGHEADSNLVNRVQEIISEFEELVPIELWLHQQAGQQAMNITLCSNGQKAHGRY